MYHKDLTGTNIHTPITWTYTNSAERLAATGFTSSDVGKFARQTDNNTLWMLVSHSPVTWVRILTE